MEEGETWQKAVALGRQLDPNNPLFTGDGSGSPGPGAIAAAGGAIAAASVSKVAMAALPEAVTQTKPDTMPPLVPNSGRPYNPVVTLNGWTLPWRMHDGVKEFHLVAEPVVRANVLARSPMVWESLRKLTVVEAPVVALVSPSVKLPCGSNAS